jgi:hypothetical protein
VSGNYFTIERGGQYWERIMLGNHNGDPAFEEFLDMSYDEMKSSEKLSDFVIAAMEATNRVSNTNDEQTCVTLIGEDDAFIWSVIMGPENDLIRYSIVDWKKDGKTYKYKSENT